MQGENARRCILCDTASTPSSRRRRDLVAQQAAAQGVFEMGSRSHLKNTMQARLCELREREDAGRKRAQVYPLRYSEHVFSRRRRDLVAQRAAAQGIFEMASTLS
jgi:hypothetical protein